MNKNIYISIVIVVIVLVLAFGWWYYMQKKPYQASNPGTGNQQQTQQQTTQQIEETAVSIANFSFEPGSLKVAPGTKITWTNNDSATHQIKSDTFSSNPLAKGETFSVTLNNPGVYNYSCAIHPTMKGVIVVQ